MLGVVIGVGAVVAMLALGEGARHSIESSIRSLGSNLLTVRPGAPSRHGVRGGGGSVETLTLEDARALESIPGVLAIAPDASRSAQVKYLATNTNTTIIGVTPVWREVRNFEVARGAFIREADVIARRRVAVLGSTVASSLFAGLDPVGERIQIRGVSFLVIGVLVEKGASGWSNPDDQVVVPISTFQRALFGMDWVSTISVQVESDDRMDEVQADVERVLRARHRIQPGAEDDFNVRSPTAMLASRGAITGTCTALLGGVAAVSLLVGGIGIMNIMLVSVRERTREIGIRKAVGARRRDILLQFLIEAVLVSVVGGLVGIALG